MAFLMNTPEWMIGSFIIALTIIAGSGCFLMARWMVRGELSEKRAGLAITFASTAATIPCVFIAVTLAQ